MIDFRPVLFVVGVIATTFGPLLLACALADLGASHADWQVFVLSAVLVMGLGGLLATANWSPGPLSLSLRQGFLLTVLSWVVLSFVGAVPFAFSTLGVSFVDAMFESVSGLTTTGSTVLTGLDAMPPGILLWRALLHWVGGVGIIATSILLLPFLRVSGMQLFRMESSDTGEKATARMGVMLRQILLLYVAATALSTLLLMFTGIAPFDAVTHAMAAISTGGLSTHDSSVGFFKNKGAEVVLVVTMFVGALTFPVLLQALRGRPQLLWRDAQIRFFVRMLLVLILVVATWRMIASDTPPLAALWSTTFNIVSVVTTTGFVSDDYTSWGPLPEMVFFFALMAGGCTGSTSGGVKAFRLYILLKAVRAQVLTRLQPHRIVRLTYDDRVVEDEVLRSVSAFVFVFLITIALAAAGLAATGLDFVSSLSGAAQAVANTGPGLGFVIGPAGNYAAVPDAAKWVLSAAMILGRLEIVVVLVVLTPAFWRR